MPYISPSQPYGPVLSYTTRVLPVPAPGAPAPDLPTVLVVAVVFVVVVVLTDVVDVAVAFADAVAVEPAVVRTEASLAVACVVAVPPPAATMCEVGRTGFGAGGDGRPCCSESGALPVCAASSASSCWATPAA